MYRKALITTAGFRVQGQNGKAPPGRRYSSLDNPIYREPNHEYKTVFKLETKFSELGKVRLESATRDAVHANRFFDKGRFE